MNEELMKEVDFRKLMDEEKKARLDNEALKGANICVQIVRIIITIISPYIVRLCFHKGRLQFIQSSSS
jgi:hypothetical protein